jgi:hypothetical protein
MTLTLEEAILTGCAPMAAETVQVDFGDVPASDPFHDSIAGDSFAPWIERRFAEGITGCGAGLDCPDNPTTSGQMAVFLVKTFALP